MTERLQKSIIHPCIIKTHKRREGVKPFFRVRQLSSFTHYLLFRYCWAVRCLSSPLITEDLINVYAVVENGGKQYRVTPGQLLTVDYISGDVNSEVRLERVLMLSGETDVKIGTPIVSGASVRATIAEQTKGEKLYVFKFKSKKRYRNLRGHRSLLTVLKIEEIVQG